MNGRGHEILIVVLTIADNAAELTGTDDNRSNDLSLRDVEMMTIDVTMLTESLPVSTFDRQTNINSLESESKSSEPTIYSSAVPPGSLRSISEIRLVVYPHLIEFTRECKLQIYSYL